MSEFRHILVATDGSRCSRRAFDRALALALPLKAQLTILHVAQSDAGAAGGAEDLERLRSHLGGDLEALDAAARAAGVKRLRAVTEVGLAYSRILHSAQDSEADLLVVGATGWGDAAGLGHVASHVAKFADCPVMIVK